MSVEMKIINLGWLWRSLTSSMFGYPSDSWASCYIYAHHCYCCRRTTLRSGTRCSRPGRWFRTPYGVQTRWRTLPTRAGPNTTLRYGLLSDRRPPVSEARTRARWLVYRGDELDRWTDRQGLHLPGVLAVGASVVNATSRPFLRA